jgi:hypothetical protein
LISLNGLAVPTGYGVYWPILQARRGSDPDHDKPAMNAKLRTPFGEPRSMRGHAGPGAKATEVRHA